MQACSCGGGKFFLDAEDCASATRVFSGVVVANDWPWVYESFSRFSVVMKLEVKEVWRGDVPAYVYARTGFGGGDCGRPTPEGTAFLVCDHGERDIELHHCGSTPELGEPRPWLTKDLGPSHTPEPAWPSFPAPDRQLRILPVLGLVLLAAAGGHWLRQRRGPYGRSGPYLPGLLLVPAIRLGFWVWIHKGSRWHWWEYRFIWVVLAAVGLAGVAVAWRGQRSGGGGRALVSTLLYLMVLVWLGFGPPHLPFQPDGVACSTERARAYFSGRPPAPKWWDRYNWGGGAPTVPQAEQDDYINKLTAWYAEVETRPIPHACIDLGLFPMKIGYNGDRCLEFPDGRGGIHQICADPRYDGVRWEWEMF